MIKSIDFSSTQQFSEIITDYLKEENFFESLISTFPSIENLEKGAEQRRFSAENRSILVNALSNRYKDYGLEIPNTVKTLSNEKCFTITTGHQLNLLTGPLYSILKIASVINLCRQKNVSSNFNWVPVFWMATEDHDLEEINHTHVYRNKIAWNTKQDGAVGPMQTIGIDNIIAEVEEILGDRFDADFLRDIKDAYQGKTLAEAHFRLINMLFKAYDLVIIDANDRDLKRLFLPVMKKEITEGFIKSSTAITNAQLDNKYKVQAFVRDLNLFYLKDNLRARLVRTEKGFEVHETAIKFTLDELELELETYPERFSPNVLTRPIYQESILPNVAYIGGGGELAYWFQLKTSFNAVEIDFPSLILRTSLGILPEKDFQKIEIAGFKLEDVFQSDTVLENKIIEEQGDTFMLGEEHKAIARVFEELESKVEAIDGSLVGTVRAEYTKVEKSLESFVGRVRKAQKRKLDIEINRVKKVKSKLLPDGSLQERRDNFLMHYTNSFIHEIVEVCDPLQKEFLIKLLP